MPPGTTNARTLASAHNILRRKLAVTPTRYTVFVSCKGITIVYLVYLMLQFGLGIRVRRRRFRTMTSQNNIDAMVAVQRVYNTHVIPYIAFRDHGPDWLQ